MTIQTKTARLVADRLPSPTYKNYEWQERAKCLGMGTEVFFLPENSRMADKRKRIATAKAVCAECPVRQQCLEYSLAVEEPYGVFGGLSEEERRRVLLKKKQGVRFVSLAD